MQIMVNSGDQVADLHPAQHKSKRRAPYPALQRLLTILATDNPRSISAAMIQAGLSPESDSIRRRLYEGGDLRKELEDKLDKAGLSLPRVLAKLSDKMDANRTVIIGKGEEKQAIKIEDNDAQLRATELVIKLHDRTGKLPTASEGASGSSITVNVLVMGEKEEK